MELIVITPGKLKIMLSPADMVKYELESVKDRETACTGKALRRICEDARAAIGFETEGERLFVQFYASREGGGELFVTKLGRADTAGLPLPSRERTRDGEAALLERIHSLSDRDAGLPAQSVKCFCFNGLRDLTLACKALISQGFSGISNAYISENSRAYWYLSLSSDVSDEASLSRAAVLLSEFGRELPEPQASLYLTEHARLLCGSCAVPLLSRF